eukprot:gene17687-10313_t
MRQILLAFLVCLAACVCQAGGQAVCCNALTAACLACSAGSTVSQICEKFNNVPGCDEDDGHSVDTTTSGPVPMATTCTDAVNQVRCQEGKVETCQWNVFLATCEPKCFALSKWACIHRGGEACYYHDPSNTCVATAVFEEPEEYDGSCTDTDDCCDAEAMCILPRGAEEQTMCVLPNDLIGRNVQDGNFEDDSDEDERGVPVLERYN